MKWEYKEVEYISFPSVEKLNVEGKSGWELVFLQKFVKETSPHYEFFWNALFKRSIIKRPNTGPK